MKIDLISDIACPWCAVGLASLDRAIERLGPDFPVEVQVHPFELNPGMGPQGEDLMEHLQAKYRASAEQLRATQQVLHERGAAVGFAFGDRQRIWNTFDGHRLLHWASQQGRGVELKRALLLSYHGRGENPGDPAVLERCAVQAGLDAAAAREVIASGQYAAEVRAQEEQARRLGIHSVPSFILDGRHLVQGGQPPEVFEQAIRSLATA